MTEITASKAAHLFVGKTIQKMDAAACNNIEFLFTDGSRVALHIDCDGMGLPDVAVCTHCAEIEAEKPAVSEEVPLNSDPSFHAGRQLLIEGGEKAIDMIASGNFYEDYDASTEALGDLRSLLDVVKDTLK